MYDNTLKNATQCQTKDDGKSLQGCYGGIPFPIPKTGVEVAWNHLLRVENESTETANFKNIVLTADGSRTLATMNDQSNQYPYYYKDGSAGTWSGEYFLQRFSTIAPPFKAGESLELHVQNCLRLQIGKSKILHELFLSFALCR